MSDNEPSPPPRAADLRAVADTIVRDAKRRAARLLVLADRLDAALPTWPRPPMTSAAVRAAAYIRANPGRTGDEVAKAIDVEPTYFRRHVMPVLRPNGFTGSRTFGYRPPASGSAVCGTSEPTCVTDSADGTGDSVTAEAGQ